MINILIDILIKLLLAVFLIAMIPFAMIRILIDLISEIKFRSEEK